MLTERQRALKEQKEKIVDDFKLKGSVAEYMHIIKQETGKDAEVYKLELS